MPPRYTFLPNLRLWDRDAQALFAIVRESEFDANRVALSPEYIAYILRNRLPALPPWYNHISVMYKVNKLHQMQITKKPKAATRTALKMLQVQNNKLPA